MNDISFGGDFGVLDNVSSGGGFVCSSDGFRGATDSSGGFDVLDVVGFGGGFGVLRCRLRDTWRYRL